MEEKSLILNDMEEILTNSGSNQKVFTTIQDKKVLFNLYYCKLTNKFALTLTITSVCGIAVGIGYMLYKISIGG